MRRGRHGSGRSPGGRSSFLEEHDRRMRRRERRGDDLQERLASLTNRRVARADNYGDAPQRVTDPDAGVVFAHSASSGTVSVEGTGDELVVAVGESSGSVEVENVGAVVGACRSSGGLRVEDAEVAALTHGGAGPTTATDVGLCALGGRTEFAEVDAGERVGRETALERAGLGPVGELVGVAGSEGETVDPDEEALARLRGWVPEHVGEGRVGRAETRVAMVPSDEETGPAAVVSHPDADVLVRVPGADADAEAFEARLEREGLALADFDAVVSLDLDDHADLVAGLADDVEPEDGPRMVYPVRAGADEEILEVFGREAEHATNEFVVHGEDDVGALELADGLTLQSLAFAPGDETGSRQIAAVVDEDRDAAFVFAGESTLDGEAAAVESRVEVAARTFDLLNDDRLSEDATVALQAPAGVDPDGLAGLADAVDATEVWFDHEPERAAEADGRGWLERVGDRLAGESPPASPADALDDDVTVRVGGDRTAPGVGATGDRTEPVTVDETEEQLAREPTTDFRARLLGALGDETNVRADERAEDRDEEATEPAVELS